MPIINRNPTGPLKIIPIGKLNDEQRKRVTEFAERLAKENEAKTPDVTPQGRRLGVYRHIGHDGHAQTIPEPLVEAQLNQGEMAAVTPPAEVSLASIARKLGRMEHILIALVTVLEERCADKPSTRPDYPPAKPSEGELAMWAWQEAIAKAQPRVTFNPSLSENY